jgi:hypothetical protein
VPAVEHLLCEGLEFPAGLTEPDSYFRHLFAD